MNRRDSIRKEWNTAADGWIDFVRTGKDYTRYGLNNPATFQLIGNVKGLIVLDLACGEGYNTRILARKGAVVTGVDFSEKMIEYAKLEEAKEKQGIDYRVSDTTNLSIFTDEHFDLVTCFMSLQDIKCLDITVSEVSRILKINGRFVFSIPHPCFEQIRIKGVRVHAANAYFEKIKYPIDWNMERLSRHFKTSSFHRALTDYFTSLHSNNFVITKFEEPRLSEQNLKNFPYLKKALVRPQSVVIESRKVNPSFQINESK